jgi:F0F1-type ATP synthase assembly protein I
MIGFSGKSARQMALALQIPTMPIAGGFFGYYVDRYFRTDPLFTLLFGVLGIGAAILYIARLAREMSNR